MLEKNLTNLYSPNDFINILSKKLIKEPFIVGGQAVNIWGLYYSEYTSEFKPFVSKDFDLFGTRETLTQISKVMGVEPHYFSMTPPTNQVGFVIFERNEKEKIPIEILDSIYGVKNEELEKTKHKLSIGNPEIIVSIPSPIALLKAKIANVADLSQKDRQDEKHICILAKLIPFYLADSYRLIEKQKKNERDILNLLEFLLEVLTSKKADKILEDLKIEGINMFSEIKPIKGSKIDSFFSQRLKRVFN